MKFHKATVIGLILFISVLSACSSDDDQGLSSTKKLTEFTLDENLNPGLPHTISGAIDEGKISLELPSSIDQTNLIASFKFEGEQILVESVPQESGKTEQDFSEELTYVVEAENGETKEYKVEATETESKAVLPHIYVSTNDPNVTPDLDVNNKRTKFKADLKIDGKGEYEDYEGSIKIRGRGNSTWGMAKKPYKLLLDEAASLLGLAPYRKWILLNEYLDGTMLYNSIPFKTGELLGMPYTHNVIPVQVTFNDEYRGVYAFMEHKEVGEERIDIGDDGLLLELDAYFDEEWQFYSDKYELPVMLQYPKDDDMTQNEFEGIKNDFEEFEALVYDSSFPDNDYLDYFDDESFVNYMIVYTLTANEEINHPKSTYINKPAGGKYRMGILWDFDWGFGYEENGSHYQMNTAANPLFWNDSNPGTDFFSRLLEDPHIQELLKEQWSRFKDNKYAALRDHVKHYSEIIRLGLEKDHGIWGKRGSTGDPDQDLQKVLNWLDARVDYMDGYINSL